MAKFLRVAETYYDAVQWDGVDLDAVNDLVGSDGWVDLGGESPVLEVRSGGVVHAVPIGTWLVRIPDDGVELFDADGFTATFTEA